MHTSPAVLPASFDAAPPELKPVAVTRWSARLADPQCERDYRVHRFTGDRRRALLLMTLVAVAGLLNFLVELYAYRHGASRFVALIPPFATICLPIAGLLIVRRLRTPRMLELLMVAAAAVGTITRMVMVSLHPNITDMGPALMVGILFVIYLYLPIRFVTSVAWPRPFRSSLRFGGRCRSARRCRPISSIAC
jgi:hypothetical protein